MVDRKPTTLEDFHAGRESRFSLEIKPQDGTDGLTYWVASVTTEDGERLAACEADNPSAAIAGATGAANDSLARIHIAGRIGSEELQEKLGLEGIEDRMRRALDVAA